MNEVCHRKILILKSYVRKRELKHALKIFLYSLGGGPGSPRSPPSYAYV